MNDVTDHRTPLVGDKKSILMKLLLVCQVLAGKSIPDIHKNLKVAFQDGWGCKKFFKLWGATNGDLSLKCKLRGPRSS